MKEHGTHSMKGDEIDLLELLSFILLKKKQIIKFVVVFFLVGVFLAIFSPKEYTAKTVVVVQTSNQNKGGSLSSFAALAGVNLGLSDTEFISTQLYPKIIEGILFRRDLIKTKITLPNSEDKVTFKDYFLKHQKFNLLSFIKSYTIGLPGKILRLFRGKQQSAHYSVGDESSGLLKLSNDEVLLFDQIERRLTLNNNIKEGYLSLSFSMPEPIQAAQMTEKARELLQRYVIEFKTRKLNENYSFVKNTYDEAKKEFLKKQSILAGFNDRNMGLITSRSQSRLKQLESEYNLAYDVYSELAKKLETQKIKLKEDSPLFTVIEPVSVPVNKSKPRRGMIVLLWSFLGLVVSIVFIFVKKWLEKVKK